jgi:hypothetical protein
MKHVLMLACAMAMGCADDPKLQKPATLAGELSLELRDTAALTVEPSDGGARFAVTPSVGFGYMNPGETLLADGYVEALPEANAILYSATFHLASTDSSSPCGGGPAVLSLSLHRQDRNAMVIGGIAVYCGDSFAGGVPVRVLRLAGDLPL